MDSNASPVGTQPPIALDSQGVEKKKKKSPPKDLSGVALIEYKCRRKKRAWSECVGTFYGRFSSGNVLEDEEADCDDLFEKYRECYMKGMLKERQRKGLDSPKEGTVLAEFIEEEGIEASKDR